jgi:predicted ArsR family transcriptional regulator
MAELSDAKRRIIERLKRIESATAGDLAEAFALTATAVRQHLDSLQAVGLVTRRQVVADGRGRPPTLWALTPLAADLFPDRHGELTVELVASIRTALGEAALQTVLDERAERQLTSYRQQMTHTIEMAVRVRRLAEVRTAEGYLAEVELNDDGSYTLTEHHCPIHDAAATCVGLCASELALFQRTLGDAVTVTRTQHLLGGDARCRYRIAPVAALAR